MNEHKKNRKKSCFLSLMLIFPATNFIESNNKKQCQPSNDIMSFVLVYQYVFAYQQLLFSQYSNRHQAHHQERPSLSLPKNMAHLRCTLNYGKKILLLT